MIVTRNLGLPESEIEQYQAAHDPSSKPLAGLDPAEQDEALVKICQVIKAVTSGKLEPLP